MDHNLKKEEKQFIALIIGFIVVIIFGLMAMFISQFGGLEALTPLHFALGFIKAGIVCFLYSFLCSVYMETDESRDRSKSGKPGGGKRQRMWLERQGSTGMDFQNTIQ